MSLPLQVARVTRRRFLQGGAGLAAAFCAPWIVPRSALAAPGAPGANERIGVGYVGFGRRAPQIGLTRDAATVAVADCNLPQAEAVAARYQAKAFLDYRKMLELPEVDAVIVATPDHWHALPSIHACQAGKDVFCEKPLSLTIREGRAMAAAARKYGRVFQTGSQQRSDARCRFGCELVRNGRIGKVHTVLSANYPSPWHCGLPGEPVPAGLDWDLWCGPTEPRPFHSELYPCRARPGWLSFHAYSGGEMTGWGSHGLDQVQWALGTDDTGPVEIWTEGEKFDPPTYTEPETKSRGDAICSKPNVFMRYAGGAVMRLGGGPGGGAVFIGEKGRITIDRGRVTAEPAELLDEPLPADAVRLEASNNHVQNWFDCIRSRKPAVADVEIGHRSATVCHLGNIARWLSRKAVWDPAAEVFPGDDEANAYLERPMRKPYQLPEVI
jgi:predicted dehydrogenase